MSKSNTTQTIDNNSVLKKEMTKSVTGKSFIHYELGNDPEGVLHIRITVNTGGGYFSNEWIRFDAIYKELDRIGDQPVSSYHLKPLYEGKSVNTPAFLLAAMKNEGLLVPHPVRARCYAKTDPSDFIKATQALSDESSTSNNKPEPKPKAKLAKAA